MDKKEFRKKVRVDIEGFDEAYIIDSDDGIYRSLTIMPELLAAKTVFIYHSVGREVDTLRLIRFCLAEGKRVALPVTKSLGEMDFAVAASLGSLVPGEYGIPEPPDGSKEAVPEKGDVIIVPALCYDEALYRLGRGGGYYDRFLSGSPAVSIGLCREKLVFSSIPTEAQDVPVDILVTEKKRRGR